MARPSKAETLAAIHREALTEFDAVQSALRDVRLECLTDRRFATVTGGQWEGLTAQFENKPMLEVNKVHLAVLRLINEFRNNKVTVDFVSKEGDEYDKLADLCDGLYRADEQDSGAEEAYLNAFEEAVTGGFGAFRLRTAYEDEEDDEDERQRIRIEPIFDADTSVFFDLQAKRQDKADARKCWVITSYTREAYTEEFGDDPQTWPKMEDGRLFDWFTPDVVYVAEYYRVEEKPETIHIFRHLDGREERFPESVLEDQPETMLELEALGAVKVREKKVKRRRVHKYILSGGGILEDCGVIAGRHIPVVPVYGKRWFVDGIERCMGHVRLAKDAQRLKNMQLSKLAELSAKSSVPKPIFLSEQVSGHEQVWADDAVNDYPFLTVNPVTDANGQIMPSGPIAYTQPPQIPPAMAALLQLTEVDMAEILGNNQQAEKVVSNTSGKAIEMIQQRLDSQAFIYMDNMRIAVRRAGEIWLSMAREVYVEEGRKMKTAAPDGTTGSAELAKPTLNEDGELEYENDSTEADFDLYASTGPTSESKRQSTVRNLISIMAVTQDPETLQVLNSLVLMNMDGEGMQDLRDWVRARLIRMGAVKPTEEEAQQLAQEAQNAKPDPQAAYLESAAAAEKAKTIKTLADAELSQAKTAETYAGIDAAEIETAIKAAQALQPQNPVQ